MTRRFPKKLVVLAGVLELLILTVANPTKLVSSMKAEPEVRVNFMSMAPALPNASGSTMKVVRPATAPTAAAPVVNVKGFPARPFTVDDGETIVVEKAPQPVL